MTQLVVTHSQYVKAWLSFGVISVGFNAVVKGLGLLSFLSLPFSAAGMSDEMATTGGAICLFILTLFVSYFAFRTAVKQIILRV